MRKMPQKHVKSRIFVCTGLITVMFLDFNAFHAEFESSQRLFPFHLQLLRLFGCSVKHVWGGDQCCIRIFTSPPLSTQTSSRHLSALWCDAFIGNAVLVAGQHWFYISTCCNRPPWGPVQLWRNLKHFRRAINPFQLGFPKSYRFFGFMVFGKGSARHEAICI